MNIGVQSKGLRIEDASMHPIASIACEEEILIQVQTLNSQLLRTRNPQTLNE